MRTTQLSMLTAVLDGHVEELRSALAALPLGEGSPFARVAGTHNGRWVVVETVPSTAAPTRVGGLPAPMLMCSAVIDRPVGEWVADLLEVLGDGADRIWAHCAGWPAPAERVAFLLRQVVRPALPFATWDEPVDRVRAALDLHAEVVALAVRSSSMTAAELQAAIGAVLA